MGIDTNIFACRFRMKFSSKRRMERLILPSTAVEFRRVADYLHTLEPDTDRVKPPATVTDRLLISTVSVWCGPLL
jgi:hypothetical protein